MNIPQAEWHHWELIDPRGRDFGRYSISRTKETFSIRHSDFHLIRTVIGKSEFSEWYRDLVSQWRDEE